MSPSSQRPAGRRLAVSADAGRRLDLAARWLRRPDATGPILVVAPTRSAADDLLRRAGDASPDDGEERGFFAVHRPTLRQLAADLATHRLAGEGRHPVHGLALEALAARAVATCHAASDEGDELEYFAPVADLPGMAGATLRTLLELRAHALRPADLEAVDGAPPVRDLARLLRAYETALDDASLVDPPGLLAVAGEVARNGSQDEGKASHALLGLPTLFLDPTPRSPREADLLQAVADASPDVLATAVAGDAEGIGRLEAFLGPFEDLDEDRDEEPDAAAGTAGTASGLRALDRLRRRVFRQDDDEKGAEAEDPEDDDSFAFFSAAGEGREAMEIARRLVDLARRGIPFDRSAIALRDPAAYLPLVEEALQRARIPAHFSRGSVRPDPAGRAFLALLACAEEKLSASRFAEYLSLGQSPPPDEDGAPPTVEVPWVEPEGEQLVFKAFLELDGSGSGPEDEKENTEDEDARAERPLVTPRQWERLLVDAAVIEGKERWRRRLDGVAAELALQLRHTDDGEDAERTKIERELVRLEALRRFALPLVDELDALPRSATWGTWRRALEALASRALAEPRRVLSTLAELRPMDEIGPVALDEVRRVLEPRLTDLPPEPAERRHGKVWVGTVDELRGRSFDAVFLPGLAEGRFPRSPREDPLLLDVHRRALGDETGADLPLRDHEVERERLLLRLAVGATGRRLVTSYPSLDALEGRPKVPSFYALDLLRAAEGHLPDLRHLERRAAAASSSRLGWPAPRRAEDAVDDAEYDLATLLDLMEGPADEIQGAARYLLEVSQPLRRSLRHRYCRWNLKKLTPADGLLPAENEGEAVGAALEEHRLAARAHSPTALQHWAQCPLRFFYRSVLRLRPRDRPERLEQLDPLTRGSLFHEAQFALLTRLRDGGHLPLSGEDADLLYGLADEALDAVAEQYREELAPAVPRVWHGEIEGLRIDLRGWIRARLEHDDGYRPERFELAFGLSRRDAGHGTARDPGSRAEEAVLAHGWRLRGSIDLVERKSETPGEGGVLRVTDHKTGRVPDAVGRGTLRVGRGEILQPLLYALSAEALSADALSTDGALDAPVHGGRLFYCTRRGDYRTVDVPVDERGRDAVDVVLDAIDGGLAHGILPAAPRDGACRHCDFRPICGPREESRTARKRDDRLGPLDNVRRLR